MPSATKASAEDKLEDLVAECYADPVAFVRAFFPWGEPGPLKPFTGPDKWQEDALRKLGAMVTSRQFDGQHAVKPIRMAFSSGHGIGKSTMVGWLVCWIMSTRPHAQGTITANTSAQLDTKTWASIRKWMGLCLTSHWFVVNTERLYHKDHRSTWFCSAQTCREENSEAFAGQHAATSSSFYIFDEASAVPESIYEVAEGGLTDGEPMMFLFGNPTRTSGAFYKACFGIDRDRWQAVIIDSRDCAMPNKTEIAEWVQIHGEDSDFVRVRVRGLPPAASDLQFIDSERVAKAQNRQPSSFRDDPLVCGLDVARGGGDDCVFWFRRGADAASIPAIRVPGAESRDSMRLVTLAADVLGRDFGGQKIHTLFIDGTGIGGPIADRLRQLGHRNVMEVQFGAESPDPKFANMRAFMWAKLKEWLSLGCIPKAPRLEMDLVGPGYQHDKRDRVVLESKESMKKRGVDSPDDADALALTFAQVIAPKRHQSSPVRFSGGWQAT